MKVVGNQRNRFRPFDAQHCFFQAGQQQGAHETFKNIIDLLYTITEINLFFVVILSQDYFKYTSVL